MHDLNDVIGGFFRGLGFSRHVIADVVFHQLGHEAVDGAAGGGEALEGFGAGFVFIEGAEDAFELADNFLGAIEEVEFFAGKMRHGLVYPTQVWYQGTRQKRNRLKHGRAEVKVESIHESAAAFMHS